jgi:predicted DNA-binding transcriptional regulator YafY
MHADALVCGIMPLSDLNMVINVHNTTDGTQQGDRIANMAKRLIDGETLTVNAMAKEFNVHSRSIKRDFKHLDIFGLIRDNSGVRMSNSYYSQLLKVRTEAGLQEFHDLTSVIKKDNQKGNKNQESKEIDYVENVPKTGYQKLNKHESSGNNYSKVIKAIENRQLIQFEYINSNGNKASFKDVQPYLIRHINEAYYLISVHKNKIKPFRLEGLKLLWPYSSFSYCPIKDKQIHDNKTIYFGEKTKAEIRVDGNAIHYFERKTILPNQGSIIKKSDGSYIIECSYTAELEILPVIKWWIPRVKIISPIELKRKLENELREYLK